MQWIYAKKRLRQKENRDAAAVFALSCTTNLCISSRFKPLVSGNISFHSPDWVCLGLSIGGSERRAAKGESEREREGTGRCGEEEALARGKRISSQTEDVLKSWAKGGRGGRRKELRQKRRKNDYNNAASNEWQAGLWWWWWWGLRGLGVGGVGQEKKKNERKPWKQFREEESRRMCLLSC